MDKGGRHYDDDVHGLACRTRTSENKPNTRSEQIDGWMDGKGREHRAQQTAPRKKLRSPNPGSIYYTHAGGTTNMDAPLSLEYRVQGATTHKSLPCTRQARTLAHTHTISQSCRGATNVQPTYRPSTTTHKAHSLLLDRLSLQDPRQQTTVGRAENFCLGRLHLHRARPRRPLSLNLTTHGLLLLLLRLLLLLYGEPGSQQASHSVISLSVWQSVCLVCVCIVPTTYTAESSVPPHPFSVILRAGRATLQPLLEASDGTVPPASYSPLCSRLTASHTHTPAPTPASWQAPPNLDFTRSSHKRSGQRDWPAEHRQRGIQ